MAANEDALGALHTKVAQVLTEGLDGLELPTGEVDEDGKAIVTVMPASAAVITAAIQFLKNNNITCTPSGDNALGELEQKMIDRRNKMAASRDDLKLATREAPFMTGLPN